jgi:predicted nucleic acid-binding protein
VTYWDTSAILKLYLAEPDSRYFLELIAKTNAPVFSSAIAAAEALCALHRKEHAGDLKRGGAKALFQQFCEDCKAGRIVTIPYGDDVVAEAEKLVRLAFAQPRPVMIRSLDLIHVASALAGKARQLVATDQRLRELAGLVRLSLLP